MSLSAVGICNLALSRIGVSRVITDLADEDVQEAVSCNLVYEPMRDEVLREFPWPFATTYAELGLVTDASEEDPAPAWGDDWAYAYRYPSTCVRALRIVDGFRKVTTPIPFELGNDATGRLIFTDQADAVMRYTKLMTDPTLFDPSFASTLAWRIAMEIAIPLSRSDGVRQTAEAAYEVALGRARATAGNEVVDDPQGDASWISDRD